MKEKCMRIQQNKRMNAGEGAAVLWGAKQQVEK
jgi:hypothetical protein